MNKTFVLIPATVSIFAFEDKAKAQAVADRDDGYAFSNQDQMAELPSKHLVTLFNALIPYAAAAGNSLKAVTRFATHDAGVKRCWTVLSNVADRITSAAASVVSGRAKAKRTRGINLAPKAKIFPCKAGSKQSILVDMLFREQGATMSELIAALSGGSKPWAEITVRSGLNWDMNSLKGYGIRTEILTGDEAIARGAASAEDLLHVYHLVLPAGMTAPLEHTPRAGK